MLPPLNIVRRGLRGATEALARELAGPGQAMPAWGELEWRLAAAAAAAHGVGPLLDRPSAWPEPAWRQFLSSQREHVEQRHRRIAALLERIDTAAQAAELPIVALKGSALHALGLYAPGERPMADIDLLVRESDAEAVTDLLLHLGYEASFVQWKHRVFKPASGTPVPGLGEHRDTPINIELHTRIQERLPVRVVDITERVYPRYPRAPRAGLNPYPSLGALMSHLLLHVAGNICGRSLRLLHLHDIALLARRMGDADWNALWNGHGAPWWALPPLRLVARYYPDAIPAEVLARLEPACPAWLRAVSRRQTLTDVSCSELWLHALAGIEWSHSLHDIQRYLRQRLRPSDEAIRERAEMVRTQFWLQGQGWVRLPFGRRVLTWLVRPVPRMDTLYVLRAAFDAGAPAG